jgi:hypothetical protein
MKIEIDGHIWIVHECTTKNFIYIFSLFFCFVYYIFIQIINIASANNSQMAQKKSYLWFNKYAQNILIRPIVYLFRFEIPKRKKYQLKYMAIL